ncbi:MAG: transposase [Methanoregula sp.]|nr:transposase [Methanoregula sp.]MDD5187869.1 transposase [Methanoregula sp.]
MNIRKQEKKVLQNLNEVQAKVDTILKKFKVHDVLDVSIEQTSTPATKSKYGNKPERTIVPTVFHVTPHVEESAYQKAKELFEWHVYATNMSAEDLSFENVELSYRDQFIIEHEFHRLKGVCLSLIPIYLQKDNRIDGLVKFLTIALRVLGLLEIPLHNSIKKRGSSLDGLFDYNPKKSLDKPKAERVLELFDEIHLSTMKVGKKIYSTITGLNEKHREILALMDIGIGVYERFGTIQESDF